MFPDEEEWAAKFQEAETAQKEGKIDYAEATWLVTLEEAEAFGAGDTRLAMTLERVTDFYLFQGKMHEASGYGYRSLGIYEGSLGPMDPQLGPLLANLAMLNQVQNNLEEAERLFRRALAINSSTLGAGHPKVVSLLKNFADVLDKMGRTDEANQLRGSKPVSSRPTTGSLIKPPPFQKTSRDLASDFPRAADPPPERRQTVPLPRRAPIQPVSPSPPMHKTVEDMPVPESSSRKSQEARSFAEIKADAESAMRRGDLSACSRLWIEALDAVRGDGMDNPNYCYALESLGDIYFQQNELAYAERAFNESREIKLRVLGKNHGAVAAVTNLLARTYYAQGKMEQSEGLARECLEIYKAVSGPDSVDVASALHNLGTLLHMQNRYPEAEEAYKKALALNEKLRGSDDPETVKVLKALAKLLNAVGRHAEAEGFAQTVSGAISGKWRPIDVSQGEVPEAGWWKDELFGQE